MLWLSFSVRLTLKVERSFQKWETSLEVAGNLFFKRLWPILKTVTTSIIIRERHLPYNDFLEMLKISNQLVRNSSNSSIWRCDYRIMVLLRRPCDVGVDILSLLANLWRFLMAKMKEGFLCARQSLCLTSESIKARLFSFCPNVQIRQTQLFCGAQFP